MYVCTSPNFRIESQVSINARVSVRVQLKDFAVAFRGTEELKLVTKEIESTLLEERHLRPSDLKASRAQGVLD
jgi:hypothetical protein